MTDIYTRLGVPRRINAAGTLTRLGGSLMEPEVLQAMQEAAGASVDMADLQTAASRVSPAPPVPRQALSPPAPQRH